MKSSALHSPPYRVVYYEAHDCYDVVGPVTAPENEQYSVLDDLTKEYADIIVKVLNINASHKETLAEMMQMLEASSLEETLDRLYHLLELEKALECAEMNGARI